ncbi:MAG: PAS domain S-box protein [Nitrospiraceae bacterium]|nr:MAG: PAS domain S-box protein [Nitrospiraceae bacterium]
MNSLSTHGTTDNPGNDGKTREQLIAELEALQRRIAEIDKFAGDCNADIPASSTSSSFYQSILNNITTGVWVSDKDDIIYYANSGMATIAGVPADEITGRSVLSDIPEETAQYFNSYYLDARKTLKSVYYEAVPIITLSGRQSFQSGWLVPKVTNGRFDGMICTVEDVTEHKWMEDALRSSEEYFRSFIESSQDCMCHISVDGLYMSMNPAGCILNDIDSQEDIIGTALLPNITENREAVEKALTQAAKGEKISIEFQTTSRKGRVVWWDSKFTPVEDIDGSIKSILQVARDISDYKKMQGSLVHAQEMLIREHNELSHLFKRVEAGKEEWENTMDCVGDMIILTDTEGVIKRYNKALPEFTRKSHDELSGKEWESVMTESGLETVTFYAGSIELYHQPSQRWFTLSSYPLKNASLEFAGAVITLHETTEVKHITEKLEHSNQEIEKNREKLQNALDEISNLIQNVTTCTDTSIRLHNPRLRACYEVKNCTKKDCPCYGKEVTRCWQVAGTYCGGQIQGAFAQKYDNCAACEVYKEATSDPIYQIGEQFNNMMHVLEVRSNELENAYSELKATQAQILQREKMASIGQLAAGVAHEINNPMGFITSNLGTLNKYISKFTDYIDAQAEALATFNSEEVTAGLKDTRRKLKLDYVLDDIGKLIEESQEGAERVKKIVQNLKTFSRVDQAEYKPADINECIESTLNIVWNELKYKTTVEKEYGELPLVKCYPQQLNQVIMNLLVNGAQAIEKQGTIRIKTWNGDGSINIMISDTGSGIPADKLSKIFDPFFTTKPVGQGTGLGLSIAYDIIKKHKGEIRVESEVGKGTVFNIRIPVTEDKRQ